MHRVLCAAHQVLCVPAHTRYGAFLAVLGCQNECFGTVRHQNVLVASSRGFETLRNLPKLVNSAAQLFWPIQRPKRRKSVEALPPTSFGSGGADAKIFEIFNLQNHSNHRYHRVKRPQITPFLSSQLHLTLYFGELEKVRPNPLNAPKSTKNSEPFTLQPHLIMGWA